MIREYTIAKDGEYNVLVSGESYSSTIRHANKLIGVARNDGFAVDDLNIYFVTIYDGICDYMSAIRFLTSQEPPTAYQEINQNRQLRQ